MNFKHSIPENDELRCESCPAVFFNPGEMVSHQQKHKSGKYIFCTQCGRNYRSQATLAKHMNWAHNTNQSAKVDLQAMDKTLPAVVPKKEIQAAREHWRQKFMGSVNTRT